MEINRHIIAIPREKFLREVAQVYMETQPEKLLNVHTDRKRNDLI